MTRLTTPIDYSLDSSVDEILKKRTKFSTMMRPHDVDADEPAFLLAYLARQTKSAPTFPSSPTFPHRHSNEPERTVRDRSKEAHSAFRLPSAGSMNCCVSTCESIEVLSLHDNTPVLRRSQYPRTCPARLPRSPTNSLSQTSGSTSVVRFFSVNTYAKRPIRSISLTQGTSATIGSQKKETTTHLKTDYKLSHPEYSSDDLAPQSLPPNCGGSAFTDVDTEQNEISTAEMYSCVSSSTSTDHSRGIRYMSMVHDSDAPTAEDRDEGRSKSRKTPTIRPRSKNELHRAQPEVEIETILREVKRKSPSQPSASQLVLHEANIERILREVRSKSHPSADDENNLSSDLTFTYSPISSASSLTSIDEQRSASGKEPPISTASSSAKTSNDLPSDKNASIASTEATADDSTNTFDESYASRESCVGDDYSRNSDNLFTGLYDGIVEIFWQPKKQKEEGEQANAKVYDENANQVDSFGSDTSTVFRQHYDPASQKDTGGLCFSCGNQSAHQAAVEGQIWTSQEFNYSAELAHNEPSRDARDIFTESELVKEEDSRESCPKETGDEDVIQKDNILLEAIFDTTESEESDKRFEKAPSDESIIYSKCDTEGEEAYETVTDTIAKLVEAGDETAAHDVVETNNSPQANAYICVCLQEDESLLQIAMAKPGHRIIQPRRDKLRQQDSFHGNKTVGVRSAGCENTVPEGSKRVANNDAFDGTAATFEQDYKLDEKEVLAAIQSIKDRVGGKSKNLVPMGAFTDLAGTFRPRQHDVNLPEFDQYMDSLEDSLEGFSRSSKGLLTIELKAAVSTDCVHPQPVQDFGQCRNQHINLPVYNMPKPVLPAEKFNWRKELDTLEAVVKEDICCQPQDVNYYLSANATEDNSMESTEFIVDLNIGFELTGQPGKAQNRSTFESYGSPHTASNHRSTTKDKHVTFAESIDGHVTAIEKLKEHMSEGNSEHLSNNEQTRRRSNTQRAEEEADEDHVLEAEEDGHIQVSLVPRDSELEDKPADESYEASTSSGDQLDGLPQDKRSNEKEEQELQRWPIVNLEWQDIAVPETEELLQTSTSMQEYVNQPAKETPNDWCSDWQAIPVHHLDGLLKESLSIQDFINHSSTNNTSGGDSWKNLPVPQLEAVPLQEDTINPDEQGIEAKFVPQDANFATWPGREEEDDQVRFVSPVESDEDKAPSALVVEDPNVVFTILSTRIGLTMMTTGFVVDDPKEEATRRWSN